MDYTQNTVLSVNTQYAGNTVGLKKLSLRLALRKADREGWLAEHMFIMRSNGPNSRKTYFGWCVPERLRQDIHRHDSGRKHRGR